MPRQEIGNTGDSESIPSETTDLQAAAGPVHAAGLQAAWAAALELLGASVPARPLNDFIRPMSLTSVESDVALLRTASVFAQERVDKHRPAIKAALEQVFGRKLKSVRIVVTASTQGLGPLTPSAPDWGNGGTGPNRRGQDVDAPGRLGSLPNNGVALPTDSLAPSLDVQENDISARAVAGVEKRIAAALSDSDRFKRKNGKVPDFFTYPIALMFPWRVLKDPKDEHGNPLPRQNFWIGRNGSIVQIIEGGLDHADEPLGIPGHSFPLLVGMYLVTEYKSPMDKGTNQTERVVCLGDTLQEFAQSIGYLCAFRGRKADRFLERLRQYLNCTHRIIMYADDQSAYDDYQAMVATGHVPGPDERGARDSTIQIVSDYNVWTRVDLARGWNERRPFGFVTLGEEFVERYAKPHAVPLVPEIVRRLIKNPQDLALYSILTQRVSALQSKDGQRSAEISIVNLQQQAGLNRNAENKRPSGTMAAIRKRIGPVWDEVAVAKGKPECCLKYTMPEKGLSGTATKIRLHAAPPLLEFRGGKRAKSETVKV